MRWEIFSEFRNFGWGFNYFGALKCTLLTDGFLYIWNPKAKAPKPAFFNSLSYTKILSFLISEMNVFLYSLGKTISINLFFNIIFSEFFKAAKEIDWKDNVNINTEIKTIIF